ncbi:zinc finger SWIM domain-containing protein 7 isoform X3 [Haemorhous mexicanus]|uniref:zinc finger SWIM domain-containing protein 7 isoform X3 n=1 Tax=Haemorhous mexicanus TaxID=30427 RepID=UPI0028BEBFD5|nr:zinc finger SWIM domain-containing protein 7 isoform X3 [Haemorhous mexicanus]
MDSSTLPAVAEELLREIKKAFQETSQVPDDLLLGLKFIFGPSAVPALDLVDQHSVTRVRSPSGRILYQVLGSSGKLYTCYSSCHFCTCPAFGFSVLQKSESLLVSCFISCSPSKHRTGLNFTPLPKHPAALNSPW